MKASMILLALFIVSLVALDRHDRGFVAVTSRVSNADQLPPLLSELRERPEDKPEALARLVSGLESDEASVRHQTARSIELLARDQARKGVDPRSREAEPVLRLLSRLRSRIPEYFKELESRNDGTAFGLFLREVQS
jgi:hypothetical protein